MLALRDGQNPLSFVNTSFSCSILLSNTHLPVRLFVSCISVSSLFFLFRHEFPETPTASQNKVSKTFRLARLAITKWKLAEMRFSSKMADVRRGGKNPLMSVNSLRRRHLAMLTPAFPWHLVLSVCMFVGTCSFVGLSDKMRFFFFPTRGGARRGR